MNADKWHLKKIAIALTLSVAPALSSISIAANISCKVVIVGGGAAGMHSLYRLAPKLGSDVCLFEANDYFGGRIKDIASPNGQGVFGIGALRVQETQNLLFNLAKELGFDLTQQTGNFEVGYGPNRVFARGKMVENVNDYLLNPSLYNTPVPGQQFPDDINGYPSDSKGYPNKATAWFCGGATNRGYNMYNGCFNDAYYHAVLNPKYTPTPGQYSDNRTWLIDSLKPEGFQYLTDTFRFRGDFQNSVDPQSYIDFLKEDWDACCNPTYPIGGMSSFINGMLSKAKADNARTFLSEGIISINKSNGKYVLKTAKKNTVTADSVIIAVPPVGLNKIGGTIADTIKADPKFKAIVPIRVISINHWWKTPWWNNTSAADGSGPIDRAWSTKDGIPNTQVCFNFVEFGHSDYQKQQMATRSVYNDDTDCSNYWANLYKTGGMSAVNKQVVKEFNLVFPELQGTLSTKDISKAAFQDWPDAWYFLKGPTTLTNADITEWAIEPIPGEKVSLASDAYNPNRTTWADGALKSSINTLNYNYSDMTGHNARISKVLDAPLSCSSIEVINGVPSYIPFNKDGTFNANCPLQ